MTDDEFDALWNRAGEWDAPAIRTHRGDDALHVALTFHGSVMNGGLLDAVENHGEGPEHPLLRVLQAYRFLGLDDVASIIERARQEHEELAGADGSTGGDLAAERIDASYPLDGDALGAAARAAVEAFPHSFAPLS